MRLIGLIATIGLLAGCGTEVADELARSSAKSAVRPVLSERLPGVPIEKAVDCVIDAASANEILTLAASGVTGPDAKTVELVIEIAARPESVQCIATEGLAAFL